MTSANERQIGGDHYAGKYQHWDLIEKHGIGYLEGCATKYIQRWRKKNGRQDLEKAVHYIDKLIELSEAGRVPRGNVDRQELKKFCDSHELNILETSAVTLLCTWSNKNHLLAAKKDVEDLLL